MSASHSAFSPSSFLCILGVANDGSSVWVSATRMEDAGGVPGSRLRSGSAKAVTGSWRISQITLLALSHSSF